MTRARTVPKLICAAQTNPEAFFIGLLTAFVASHKQVERCSGEMLVLWRTEGASAGERLGCAGTSG